tara:strand:- start:5058 stop:5309 length:252 start_codon:yes stop_codon:yes gene_type:complete
MDERFFLVNTSVLHTDYPDAPMAEGVRTVFGTRDRVEEYFERVRKESEEKGVLYSFSLGEFDPQELDEGVFQLGFVSEGRDEW